jgi:hypothetical protein
MVGNRSAPMIRIIGALAVLLGQAACYTLQAVPGGTTPLLGQPIAVDLTDAGRVAMGGSMGPEIAQIEGRLTRLDAGQMELAVSAVRYLRGGEQGWSGEKVQVRSEHISRLYEKKLSKGRTVAASAVGIGVVVFLATRSLVGSGLGDEGKLPVDTLDSQRRPVRP